MAIHAAQQLSLLANASGHHDQAIRAGRRAVQLDSLNDGSQRALMRAYGDGNQRGAAIRQYKNFEKLMRDELGAPPEDETRALRDAYCKRMAPPLPRIARPTRLRTSDELRRIAAEFILALNGHTKLAPALVRQSVAAMIEAADALEREPETRTEPGRLQPIAA
jgi:hypothetical protein